MTPIIVTNAFSINMLDANASINFSQITVKEVQDLLSTHQWESAVGHADTANVMCATVGVEIPMNRATVTLSDEGTDTLIVAQYKGPRLEEGAIALPVGATIEWWLVTSIDKFAAN